MKQAYVDTLAGDPVSAFGGILIANGEIDLETAVEINELFCEVVIAPSYNAEALELLKSKKNRIILLLKKFIMFEVQFLPPLPPQFYNV
jgi:phosphoribosylaminoimidazolecarboxamide formyltransferase/IMP cyclohydrolase